MNAKTVIVWFRNDLRLHDNEALFDALASGSNIVPLYVFDERLFTEQSIEAKLPRIGVHRANFLIESVSNLRDQLRQLGSELIVRIGIPEVEIFEIAKVLKSSWVFCNRERTYEEVLVQDRLERNLWSIGQEVRYSRGKMLYYTADLPFPVTQTPEVFTAFRKEVEKIVPVRQPLPSPESIPTDALPFDAGEIPDIIDLGFDNTEMRKLENVIVPGGESAGLERVQEYFWNSGNVARYKKTRNGLLGLNYSSKFSPYLALGCLSPKMIFHELQKYEEECVANSSTYHLFFELLWRDFFRLMGKKHENHIFLKGGIRRAPRNELRNDMDAFNAWVEGRTGVPFIDAAMKELDHTGFMSNRARQNVASFLVNDMKVNWQLGAEYFESKLIDYDPCSNWANWNYVAGVGNDPRDQRYFNVITQAKRYDPNGEFVKHWIPELSPLPAEKVHEPFLLNKKEQSDYGLVIGRDFPDSYVRIELN
jgi:deoxyribodipyrimidine photo-lyase